MSVAGLPIETAPRGRYSSSSTAVGETHPFNQKALAVVPTSADDLEEEDDLVLVSALGE